MREPRARCDAVRRRQRVRRRIERAARSRIIRSAGCTLRARNGAPETDTDTDSSAARRSCSRVASRALSLRPLAGRTRSTPSAKPEARLVSEAEAGELERGLIERTDRHASQKRSTNRRTHVRQPLATRRRFSCDLSRNTKQTPDKQKIASTIGPSRSTQPDDSAVRTRCPILCRCRPARLHPPRPRPPRARVAAAPSAPNIRATPTARRPLPPPLRTGSATGRRGRFACAGPVNTT